MSVIHAFIDTNVLLSFYHYTKDDAKQIAGILGLIEKGSLSLYITSQVVEEYKRNRELKLSAAIKELEKWGKAPGVPRCMFDYPEAKAYSDAAAASQTARDALVAKAKADAETQTLSADDMFKQICSSATLIDRTPEIIKSAKERKEIGNPPGKKDSLGDQINWECLLQGVPPGVDLHIVSKDGDFSSPLFETRPHRYLIEEWRSCKGGDLKLYEEIRDFLKENSKDLNLKGDKVPVAVDLEKVEAIARLENSGAFAITHSAIATLSPLIGALTWSEADRILKAGINNNQIHWIGTDPDVYFFYTSLMKAFKHKIDDGRMASLEALFHPE